MDLIRYFIDENGKILVGKWGKAFIDFIVEYFQWFFDGISAVLEWSVEGTTFLLLQIPQLVHLALLQPLQKLTLLPHPLG